MLIGGEMLHFYKLPDPYIPFTFEENNSSLYKISEDK